MNDRPTLLRAVGPWALAASIFNVTVGGGIFRLPANAATALGAAAPLAYVVCAIAMGLIVLCFAEAGSRVARTGGPYAYVEVVFGPFAGFLAGVLLWLMGTIALAAVSTFFAGNLGSVFPALGSGVARALVLTVLLGGLALVNVRGVRQGTGLVSVASVAKLLPLVVLVLLALPAVREANLAIASMPSTSNLARASITLIFAFMGVESALVPSGEVRDPARTVPRAIAIAMIAVTLLYIAIQIVSQGVLGPALATSGEAPLAAVGAAALGSWGRTLIVVGAAISMFGYVSGMTLAIPRALFAFAEDGILPRALASVHPRFRTPWIAILVQTAIVLAVAITSSFEQLAVIANLSALLLYLGCTAAAWELRRRDVRVEGAAPVRLPLGPTVHLLTVLVICFLLTSIRWNEWAMVLGVLAIASLRFLFGRPRRSASVSPDVVESAA
ncbi:MAG TPA: APC family permease [Gemmatimonadaceae bacterium]|nr:APC family permease [Gemmatimonadaceae bacterium]